MWFSVKRKKRWRKHYYLPHFSDKKNEAQRRSKVCPKKHNEVMELRLESSDSKSGLL